MNSNRIIQRICKEDHHDSLQEEITMYSFKIYTESQSLDARFLQVEDLVLDSLNQVNLKLFRLSSQLRLSDKASNLITKHLIYKTLCFN